MNDRPSSFSSSSEDILDGNDLKEEKKRSGQARFLSFVSFFVIPFRNSETDVEDHFSGHFLRRYTFSLSWKMSPPKESSTKRRSNSPIIDEQKIEEESDNEYKKDLASLEKDFEKADRPGAIKMQLRKQTIERRRTEAKYEAARDLVRDLKNGMEWEKFMVKNLNKITI